MFVPSGGETPNYNVYSLKMFVFVLLLFLKEVYSLRQLHLIMCASICRYLYMYKPSTACCYWTLRSLNQIYKGVSSGQQV